MRRRVPALLVSFALPLLSACERPPKIHTDSEFQAVYLDNGQILYGRLEGSGTAYPVLRDVYFIQRQTHPETKEIRSVLLKRGAEWHAPGFMYLNDRHIVAIEPVAKESKVARLIAQAAAQQP